MYRVYVYLNNPKRNWIRSRPGRVLQKFLFRETTIKVLTPSALCRITSLLYAPPENSRTTVFFSSPLFPYSFFFFLTYSLLLRKHITVLRFPGRASEIRIIIITRYRVLSGDGGNLIPTTCRKTNTLREHPIQFSRRRFFFPEHATFDVFMSTPVRRHYA